MLKPLWNPFSAYADTQEKQVDKFLKKIAFVGIFEAQRVLLEYMQKNLVILNLFLEYKFKGYKYLKKGARQRMYFNAEKIGTAFVNYANSTKIDEVALINHLKKLGLNIPSAPIDLEKLKYFALIMSFLRPFHSESNLDKYEKGKSKPGNYYQYLEGASFGKLLVDLDKGQTMIGDCNQIVTFYVYLYSLRYEIRELQIKLPKGHVCLHFKGIDIEATSGGFAKYTEYEWLLPIVELISTNLLDVSDFRDKQLEINAREYLKGTQLVYNISSQREIVSNNLKISYHNLAVAMLKENDFETAAFFLEKSGIEEQADREFLKSIYHNAVIYYLEKNNFRRARFFAAKKGDSTLNKYVEEKEGFYYYERGELSRARELFSAAGNLEMIKATYGKEYNQVQARVAGLQDIATMKTHRSDYQKMLDLAYKMQDQSLIENLQNVLRQL